MGVFVAGSDLRIVDEAEGKNAVLECGLAKSYGDNKPSPMDELEKLASLRDKGIVSEEEFQKKKKELLGL